MNKTVSHCQHCNSIADINHYEEVVTFRSKTCGADEYHYHELPEKQRKELQEAWGYE